VNRSLVISLNLSIACGLAAAAFTVSGGFGWIAALGIYCVTGSVSLVGFALISAAAATRVRAPRRPRAAQDKPAFA